MCGKLRKCKTKYFLASVKNLKMFHVRWVNKQKRKKTERGTGRGEVGKVGGGLGVGG